MTVDGITFHSKREVERYGQLRLLQQAGHIRELTLQNRHELVVNGELICSYVDDFHYYDLRANEWVTEDVKGVRTQAYRLKKKLLKALHGISVREV